MTLRSIVLPLVLPLVAVATAACLGPRVDDTPGASTNLLPSSATVPPVTDSSELTTQITLNDGLDDDVLEANAGTLTRETGVSAGAPVRFWRLGAASEAPATIYEFFDEAGERVHPALVDAVPGDPGYNALHAVNRVVVSSAYRGQRITSLEALADAIDLGLADDPEPDGTFVNSPVVLPETQLEIGPGMAAQPERAYARGYEVGVFRFGGEMGAQPGNALIPTQRVSFLRAAHGATYDTDRPIFQATIPTKPGDGQGPYTPLSVVVLVDLADRVDPATITDDAQLFVSSPNGEILSSTNAVAQFTITTSTQILQLQFMEGAL